MGTLSSLKFLKKGTGLSLKEMAALLTSAGAADANNIPALDADGRLDKSFMPSSVPVNDRPISGFRSVIINGEGRIIQRGDSKLYGVGVGGYGGPDKYLGANASNAGSFIQSQDRIYFDGRYRHGVSHYVGSAVGAISGSSYWSGIRQLFEGHQLQRFIDRPSVLSFVVNCSITATLSVSVIVGSFTLHSFVTTVSVVANTPQYVEIPIPVIPYSYDVYDTLARAGVVTIGFLNTGTYQTATLNAFQTGTYHSAAGATNWAATMGNTLTVAELQWEAGIKATPFEYNEMGIDMMRCKRYCHVIPYADIIEAGGVPSAVTVARMYPFPATMRNTPSVSSSIIYSYGGACSGAAIAARSAAAWALVFSASGAYNLQAASGQVVFSSDVT